MNNTFRFCSFSFFVLLFLVYGCSYPRPKTDPALDKKALSLALQAKSYNQQVHSSKGLGWAVLQTPEKPGKKEKYKIAWAAQFPNKIRITFLLSGLPVETIISTGQKITFLSHTGQHSLHSYESEDPDMGRYVHVPVKMSQIILMLVGRLPIKDFNDAYFSPDSNTLSDIILRKDKETQMQYLQINKVGLPDQISITDFTDEPLYRIMIKHYENFSGLDIPSRIEVQDRLGRKLTVRISSFKANPPLKEGVFLLTDPG